VEKEKEEGEKVVIAKVPDQLEHLFMVREMNSTHKQGVEMLLRTTVVMHSLTLPFLPLFCMPTIDIARVRSHMVAKITLPKNV
jgi:hypothetical protein